MHEGNNIVDWINGITGKSRFYCIYFSSIFVRPKLGNGTYKSTNMHIICLTKQELLPLIHHFCRCPRIYQVHGTHPDFQKQVLVSSFLECTIMLDHQRPKFFLGHEFESEDVLPNFLHSIAVSRQIQIVI